jgi:hypothetical protein
MNDKNILRGLSSLVNAEQIRPDVDLAAIERSMVSNGFIEAKIEQHSSDKFEEELDRLTNDLGIDLVSAPDVEVQRSSVEEYEEYEEPKYAPEMHPSKILNQGGDLHKKTLEQERRKHIGSVIRDLGDDDGEVYSFEKEKREDMKAIMLENIETLLDALKSEKVNVDNSYNVDHTSSYEEVEMVFKKLQHKMDRIRYCTLAEEFIIWGAQSLGSLFDGEKVWFGRYRPDLVGWDNHVNVKLRRMRHDTSTVVNNIMNDYNIGPIPRLLLELVPNAVMYSNDKSKKKKQEVASDQEYMARMNEQIRSMEMN